MMRTKPLIGAATLVVLVAAGCNAERGEGGQIESAGSVDAFAMHVGDCFDDSFFGAEQISEVPGVPCSQPHDNEVYALFDVAEAKWPGDERIEELADEGCYERFAGAIGASYEESVLMYTTIYPSTASWSDLNDREVICVAYHMETEKLTGTVIKSGL